MLNSQQTSSSFVRSKIDRSRDAMASRTRMILSSVESPADSVDKRVIGVWGRSVSKQTRRNTGTVRPELVDEIAVEADEVDTERVQRTL